MRASYNDNFRWVIRDGDNIKDDPTTDNYYYFDIVYMHQTGNQYKIKVKEFVGGVIVKYAYEGKKVTDTKIWTIGGLYQNVLNKTMQNSKGQNGYATYNNKNLNEFMLEADNWQESDLSVIIINMSISNFDKRWSFQYQFAVDQYYCTIDNNYRRIPSYFLWQNPTNYVGTAEKGYKSEKLNVRVSHSKWDGITGDDDFGHFRFVLAENRDWWFK